MAAPAVMVNYWAVLVAAIATQVLGMIWYSPNGLFGKQWMALSGFNKLSKAETTKMKEAGKKSMGIAFVSSLVVAYVLTHFLQYAQARTWMEGMQGAFWIWLGFMATIMLGMVLWEGKPWKLYFINAGYWLVALLIMGAILTVMA